MARRKKPYQNPRKYIVSSLSLIFFMALILISVSQIDKIREFFSQASGHPADIHIDTQVVIGPLNRSWRNLAQGGESSSWSIEPIQAQMAALNPKYIRLDHIYDFYDIVQGSPGNLSFNFAQLDIILNNILETGAKPYLSLSYMPPAISRGDIVDQPHNWHDWQLTVQKTIEHVSGTLGIEDVYYEVWNEPDLFGNWKYYGNKNYLTLYSYAAQGAQAATHNPQVKTFKIGGPATTSLYKNWFDALAQHVIDNKLRYDFFSWHQYNHSLINFEHEIYQVREWLNQYPQLSSQLELHVTEWGLSNDNHPGYDSNYGAAHLAAGAMVINQAVDKAFIFEIQDGKDPHGQEYWGRWGLLTHQEFGSKPKPRYQALKFLDRISDQRLQMTGQGSWIKALAAKNPSGNPEFIMANADQHQSHQELVPVTFHNIDPGEYNLTLEYLNGQQNSVTVATSAGILRTEVNMPPNSVVYGELTQIEKYQDLAPLVE